MEKFERQYQSIQEEFSKQAPGWNQVVPDMLLKLAERIPLESNYQVLDVAAGSGLVSLALSAKVQQIKALDITDAMIEQGQQMVQSKNIKNIEFIKGPAEELEFDDGSFDVVITRYSFHHFLEPGKVLSEMHRVCKPGGMVVVVDLVSPPLQIVAEDYNYWERLRDPTHTWALSFEDLRQLFAGQGLQLNDCWEERNEVDFEQWVKLTETGTAALSAIKRNLMAEITSDNTVSGMNPFIKQERLKFYHQIGTVVGIKPA